MENLIIPNLFLLRLTVMNLILYDSTNHNLEAAFPELFWVVFFLDSLFGVKESLAGVLQESSSENFHR